MKYLMLATPIVSLALLAFGPLARAENVFCESPDKLFQFEVRENDSPSEAADWRIAHFYQKQVRQKSIYTVYRTSRADRVLYVSEGNRKSARLDLGAYSANGEYPEASLITYVPGGGYLTTAMSCSLEGKVKFVNHCAGSRKEVLGKRLVVAAREGDVERAENLLECGADPNFVFAGCNAVLASLDPACGGAPDSWRPFPADGVPELANLLLDRGALMDTQENRSGESTVHKAVRFVTENGHLDFLQLLIGLEASLNVQDKSGKTPLMLAVLKQDLDTVQALVEGGADIDLRDRSGRTAYAHAKSVGFKEALNFLVAPSEVITIQGNEEGKCTPENIAVKKGGIVRFVLKAIPDKMFKMESPKLDVDLMAERGSEIYKNVLLSVSGDYPFTCGFHGGNSPTRGVIKVK